LELDFLGDVVASPYFLIPFANVCIHSAENSGGTLIPVLDKPDKKSPKLNSKINHVDFFSKYRHLSTSF